MPSSTHAKLALVSILGLVALSGAASAGAGTNDISFQYVSGIPFSGTFTDPADFTCANGNFPQHNPPSSFERRCVPNWGAVSCTDLEAKASVAVGAIFPSSMQVNSSCSNGVSATVASCTAMAPPYPSSCSNGPVAGPVAASYTFFCHVMPSGSAVLFTATCRANTT